MVVSPPKSTPTSRITVSGIPPARSKRIGLKSPAVNTHNTHRDGRHHCTLKGNRVTRLFQRRKYHRRTPDYYVAGSAMQLISVISIDNWNRHLLTTVTGIEYVVVRCEVIQRL